MCFQHFLATSNTNMAWHLGMDLLRRWPRLVQTLGVSEDQALEIVETDVTPL